MPLRFAPGAADQLRGAIQGADGVEVFAIGDVDGRDVVDLVVVCRGTPDQVPALVERPRAGQVVIHNHPSGDLTPSEADLALAHQYGEDGVGVVIVDSAVSRDRWVVEPHHRAGGPVDDAALERFFTDGLPRALPDWESRPQQIEMARRIATSLDTDQPVLCEAGTGTGKSLAYLVPAALWALANDSKVVVSTHTKALQHQLMVADLPLLPAGGIDVRTAVLQGRNNYLCRRRLALLRGEGLEGDDGSEIENLWGWASTTATGSRTDIGFPVSGTTWERVLSDSDLTLSVRCPHYSTCCYYSARRNAAAAHVIVVNHALLLTDLALRADVGRGFLPRYSRVVIDEAHHLEGAATSVATEQLSGGAIRRALRGLQDSPRRRGSLSRLVAQHPDKAPVLGALAAKVDDRLAHLAREVAGDFARSGTALIPDPPEAVRITEAVEDSPAWSERLAPALDVLGGRLQAAVEALDQLDEMFDAPVPEDRIQPLLDIRRARRRLLRHLAVAAAFVDDDPDRCRWVEPARRGPHVALAIAPIEVGPVLERILWGVIGGVACTSATLAIGQGFHHWKRRTGLDRGEREIPLDEVVFPSPFDHATQAALALPRDLPPPEEPGYLDATIDVARDAIDLSDGGAFVLCTSHAAVAAFAEALIGRGRQILAQGQIGRSALLERFMADPRAVLVGTDSFWEGVSVRGEGLRLVIIPRLPFRVPTDPLHQARYERIVARSRDPFREYALPEAILKLRQGYGRLVRSHTDRGVVLLLDRRIHDRRYGPLVLHSLPPARRIKGPWRHVRALAFETGSS